MRIELCCIPRCPLCKRVELFLMSENIPYDKRLYDPGNDDDTAEMCARGIYRAQFPVVYLDGVRLPAMTIDGYAQAIRRWREKGRL